MNNLLALLANFGLHVAADTPSQASRPNIVLLLSDDQDRRLGSTDFQGVLQRELVTKGTEFINHHVTVAQCCPSRTSLFRGQAAHNTNVTHVQAPGGNYDKFVLSGENNDYLPFWLKSAGYRAEYLGKFFNGYTVLNYNTTPKGWDHADCLVDPYTYAYNTVVMSQNGERPVLYSGYHQSDVIRAKALARLDYLTSNSTSDQHQPFFLEIAPTAPHVAQQGDAGIANPVPLSRHLNDFPNATAPRVPNFNPPDPTQSLRSNWVGSLPALNETQIAYADEQFRARIRSLQGVDEILEDVIALLDSRGQLDNTFIIFTSGNGYHIGTHRAVAGKALPYAEDTNVPFVVRGPGVPANVKSRIPGAHLDLAPTFLDIAGVSQENWPRFFDGRSLLRQWQGKPEQDTIGKELLNVEFWGGCHFEAPPFTSYPENSYKTLRIFDEADNSWLYAKWCSGDEELYDTSNDPYELENLAVTRVDDTETRRLINRLNALLMVTKSCSEETCRNPWSILRPPAALKTTTVFDNLNDAMDPAHDAFFAGFPRIAFKECMTYQYVPNEEPFYPASSAALQEQYRLPTDNFVSVAPESFLAPSNDKLEGAWYQRHVTLDTIMLSARQLRDDELVP
ncbi:arylsulfatase [Diaporthe amygdali]|uniref:arylsulfatase n=1 Tax=Phomopsis amygdali TaxID=1214568 RepID=UPI0022FF18AF|nr:arylsulfatase [Diaporthe amygdali]KAJ0109320.1 arylsulfatase [Diaporthe amygdali]